MIKIIDTHRPGSPLPPAGSPRSPARHTRTQGEELRLQKDISELDLPSNVQLRFPRGNDHMCDFEVALTPDEGCYAGGTFLFAFKVPESYPNDPPQVKALTQVFHPAIDTEGHVDMSLLDDEWRPEMGIKQIVYGLNRLFLMPDTEDSLNSAAGSLMHTNRPGFDRMVEASVQKGASYEGTFYPAAVGERNVHACSEG